MGNINRFAGASMKIKILAATFIGTVLLATPNLASAMGSIPKAGKIDLTSGTSSDLGYLGADPVTYSVNVSWSSITGDTTNGSFGVAINSFFSGLPVASLEILDLSNKAGNVIKNVSLDGLFDVEAFATSGAGSFTVHDFQASVTPTVAVPGPEVGTGLAALAMAGVAAIAYRRKCLAA